MFAREKDWKLLPCVCFSSPFCAVVVLSVERTRVRLWSFQSMLQNVWVYMHPSYPPIWKNMYILSYVIHTVTSLTCCFLTTGLPVCICSYFFRLMFFFFLLLKGYPNTVYAMTVPCPLAEPVIIVHPVNRIPFYFVDACFFLFLFFFMHLSVYFPHDSFEAVAKCVSFNPTGTHTKPCVHASFVCIYCL